MLRRIAIIFLLCLPITVFADDNVVNVYAWSGEVPDFIIQQFEKETGIKVNMTAYENNEIMYAKLKASTHAGYDLIQPSSYFVDRMRHENMLEPIDHSKIPNWKNLNPHLLHLPFDPQSSYSMPYLWGTTGIFYNNKSYQPKEISKWSDLWDERFENQLLLLDDTREVFSMALLSLGYSINDQNPDHIKAAYLKLKELVKNVKVFSTDTVISILIDEDATAGMVWNGDDIKAHQENPNVQFIYPKEGFVIWIDNFAIPKNPPHKAAAYTFLNFLSRPDIAKQIALTTGFPTANLAAQKLLPDNIRNDSIIYPSQTILRHGQYQTDTNDATRALYEKYWEELKMGM